MDCDRKRSVDPAVSRVGESNLQSATAVQRGEGAADLAVGGIEQRRRQRLGGPGSALVGRLAKRQTSAVARARCAPQRPSGVQRNEGDRRRIKLRHDRVRRKSGSHGNRNL